MSDEQLLLVQEYGRVVVVRLHAAWIIDPAHIQTIRDALYDLVDK